MKSISVLMSTYNGDKYIREQLDSLLSQKDVLLNIIIRDDGSNDSTPDIIENYAKNHSNIKAILDTNCGAEKSFNLLCNYALRYTESDYYAFCDQDDVWDNDKLIVAIEYLEKFTSQKPNLYFSNLSMVDENLTFIRNLFSSNEVFTNKEKTLVQIFTYGCTCVFNHKALALYCLIDNNKGFHDNWIYVLCSYLGNVIYDPHSHIKYRQHNKNLSGHHKRGFSLFIQRIKRALAGNWGHNFEPMACQLLSAYSDMLEPSDAKIIRHVSQYRRNLSSKIVLLFSSTYATGHFFKDLCIKFRIMTNHL